MSEIPARCQKKKTGPPGRERDSREESTGETPHNRIGFRVRVRVTKRTYGYPRVRVLR